EKQLPVDAFGGAFSIDSPVLTGLMSVSGSLHSGVVAQTQRPEHLIQQGEHNGDKDRDGNEQPLFTKANFLIIRFENGNHRNNAHDHPDEAKNNKEGKWDILHILFPSCFSDYLSFYP
ncbi:MAG TPA: hypothetical protein V6D04_04895, partial [Candidatus Obscuribacterales bacterium]